MSYINFDNLYKIPENYMNEEYEVMNEIGDTSKGQTALNNLQAKSKFRLHDTAKEFGKRAAQNTPNGGLLEKLHRDVRLQDKLKDKTGIGGNGSAIVRDGVKQGYYNGLRQQNVPAKESLSRAKNVGKNAW